jgi:hypothetical protein
MSLHFSSHSRMQGIGTRHTSTTTRGCVARGCTDTGSNLMGIGAQRWCPTARCVRHNMGLRHNKWLCYPRGGEHWAKLDNTTSLLCSSRSTGRLCGPQGPLHMAGSLPGLHSVGLPVSDRRPIQCCCWQSVGCIMTREAVESKPYGKPSERQCLCISAVVVGCKESARGTQAPPLVAVLLGAERRQAAT